MKLINVDRILRFKWLKKIDFNIYKRKNAGKNFEKYFLNRRIIALVAKQSFMTKQSKIKKTQ